MIGGSRLAVVVVTAALAGCAAPPAAPRPAEPAAPIATPTPLVAEATPMVEYPPMEAVEPPVSAPAPAPAPASTEPAGAAAPLPESEPVAPTPPPPSEPTDEQQLAGLLADLQRYGTLAPDDLRRELNAVTQLLGRQRTDYNRVRLAVLYTLAKTSPQDDQRALQLFDSVTKSSPGTPAVKQLAAVLQAQVVERTRAVRDEQAKAEAAVKKLEALRIMERDLLRDRVRGGGGGSGSGGSGGGGGGGGGGG